jgi:hypothetical protein
MEQRVGVRSLLKMEQRVGVRSLLKMEQRVGVRSLLQMEQRVGVRSLLFSRRDIQGYIVSSKYTRNFVYESLMSSCGYNWSPASMVICLSAFSFLTFRIPIDGFKSPMMQTYEYLLTFSWNQKQKGKSFGTPRYYLSSLQLMELLTDILSLFLGAKNSTPFKRDAFLLCKYVETCVSSLLHIIDS